MSRQLLDKIEQAHLKPHVPEIRIGDTVDVHTRIVEGEKERVQVFTGVVIAKRGRGVNSNFIIRRIVGKEGVERTFMLHSPNVLDIVSKRRGKVRRAKLFYLRQRVGKARKLKELRPGKSSDSGKSKKNRSKSPGGAELAAAASDA